MRRVTGIVGNEAGGCAKHALNRLIRTIPIVVGKRAGAPEGATVAFNIAAPVPHSLHCTITNGRGAVSDGLGTDALTTINLDSTTFFNLRQVVSLLMTANTSGAPQVILILRTAW